MGLFGFGKKKPEPPVSQAAPRPALVKRLSVEELKARLDRGDTPLILDVREPWEYNVVHLEQATLMPMGTVPARLAELDKNAEIVVQCHHGNRSMSVAYYLAQNGFTNVANLEGGIDAWAREIDRTKATY